MDDKDDDAVEPSEQAQTRLTRRDFARLLAVLVAAPAAALEGCSGDDGPNAPDLEDDEGTAGAGDGDGDGDSPPDDDGPSDEEGTPPAGDGDVGDGDSGDGDGDVGDGDEPAPDPTFMPDEIQEDLSAFPTAVLAGAMRETSALLKTHVPGLSPVLLRVWLPDVGEGARIAIDREVTPDADGYVSEALEGLSAGSWYRYAFFTRDAAGELVARSSIGSFRTALPAEALEPITVAISACNGIGNAPWPALLRTADEQYDAFLHVGDMAYQDGFTSLDQYRTSWRDYLKVVDAAGTRQGLAAAFSRAGLYATLDDHEITDNFDPETIDEARREAALKSYFEVIPLEGASENYRLWRSYRWGKTLEVFVVDSRTERKPSTRHSADAIYLSRAQMDWLKAGLAESPCHFKVVMNSVPITNMPGLFDIDIGQAAGDRWEGYKVQRDELLGHIRDANIGNVWFVSGDLHICFAAQVEPSGAGVLGKTYEVAVTGGNRNPLGNFLGPDFLYGKGEPRGAILTFDPMRDDVLVRFIHPDDGSDDYSASLSQA